MYTHTQQKSEMQLTHKLFQVSLYFTAKNDGQYATYIASPGPTVEMPKN